MRAPSGGTFPASGRYGAGDAGAGVAPGDGTRLGVLRRCWQQHCWQSVKVSGDWTKPHRDWLPDLAIYQDWSKRLPEWVFTYLAPTTPISLGNGQGFLKFPVVLNKGEALSFVATGA